MVRPDGSSDDGVLNELKGLVLARRQRFEQRPLDESAPSLIVMSTGFQPLVRYVHRISARPEATGAVPANAEKPDSFRTYA